MGLSFRQDRVLWAKTPYTKTRNLHSCLRTLLQRYESRITAGSSLRTYVDVLDEVALLESSRQEADHVDRSFVLVGLGEMVLNAKTESNRVRRHEHLASIDAFLLGSFIWR